MFKHINPNELAEKIKTESVQIVDIRDTQSYQMGHIPLAKHIDNANISQFLSDADHNLPLIVCCYHGNSSQGAADYFNQQGFCDVYSLDGGFELWRSLQPDSVETSN